VVSATSSADLAAMLRPTIQDARVLAAIAAVPRDRFVPPERRAEAFLNAPLPIGCGQTISQPLVVARMCELLELSPEHRVLDVGTGSGYHAAVLAMLCSEVHSIERHGELSQQARMNLEAAGIDNVWLYVGDGSRGLPEQAPFDAINVGAAAWRSVPPALEQQLAIGGRLVAPIARVGQRLALVRRTERGFARRLLEPVRFVPLVQK
jgi:protein-L-isoaspartate(D-aspartate) O-methyltransferase